VRRFVNERERFLDELLKEELPLFGTKSGALKTLTLVIALFMKSIDAHEKLLVVSVNE